IGPKALTGFSACERDRGVCPVLNAKALVVAFLLPLLSGDVCIHAKCRALGGLLTSGLRRRRSARPREAAARVFWRFEVLVEFSARSLREDVVWSGGNAERTPIFAFFAKCGTVEVCVVFLDTLTPMFELYVRLRERRQWSSDFPELVFSRLCQAWTCSCMSAGVVLVALHSCLTCSHGAAVGPFVRDCETERLFLCCVVRLRFDPFEVCPGVGTVVTAVVACGVPEWWHSFGYG
ncbi:hypothetical protein Taro_022237, partial [Colocasia esculenta]|nr:hypothetical protein [Colocasia esculenta]